MTSLYPICGFNSKKPSIFSSLPHLYHFVQTIEWLRLIPVVNLRRLDLRHNFISGRGAHMLALWLLALSGDDLNRDYPLEVDLKHNLVNFVFFFCSQALYLNWCCMSKFSLNLTQHASSTNYCRSRKQR